MIQKNSEMMNEILKRIQEIENDEDKLNMVIKIQRNLRSHQIISKLKSTNLDVSSI